MLVRRAGRAVAAADFGHCVEVSGRVPPQGPAADVRNAERADGVTIVLDRGQVAHVVRAAGDSGRLSARLSGLAQAQPTLAVVLPEIEDRRLSRSLLIGLLMLASMPDDGSDVGVAELARLLEMNTSTLHRYLTTLVAVGLVERDPKTRRYRLAR